MSSINQKETKQNNLKLQIDTIFDYHVETTNPNYINPFSGLLSPEEILISKSKFFSPRKIKKHKIYLRTYDYIKRSENRVLKEFIPQNNYSDIIFEDLESTNTYLNFSNTDRDYDLFENLSNIRSPRAQAWIEKDKKSLEIQSSETTQSNLNHLLNSPFLQSLQKFTNENDYIIKLVEDHVIFLSNLRNAYVKHRSGDNYKYDILMAIVTHIKMQNSSSLFKNIIDSKLISYADSLFDVVSNSINFETQSFEEYVSTLRDSVDKFDLIKESEFFKKVYRLSLYALSLSLFDKLGITLESCGYNVFEQEALKRKYHVGADFARTIIDTILFLCEKGFQIIKTGNYETIFHSGKEYTVFYDRAIVLKRQATLLSNPEAHGFKESTFRAELDDVIEIGENIYQHSNKMSTPNKHILRNLVNELQFIRCDLCTKRAAREHRKAPFSVLIFGESGVGKSTIKDILFFHYAKLKGLEADSSFCYTRNPVANFWDGFTTSQWAVVLDDIASIHPNKAPNGDPSMMELIQIVNSVPFVPDQADLSNKGRTPLKCEFVMATSNIKTLHANQYFTHPSAVQRRLPYIITPTVKKEYARSDGTLDSNLVTNVADEYPDLWHWKVEKVNTRKTTDNSKLADIEVLLEADNIIDMLKWFNQAVKQFDHNQNIVSDSIDTIKHVEVCQSCFLPVKNCECQIQSVVSTISFFSEIYILFFNMLVAIVQSWFVNKIDTILSNVAWYLVLRSFVICRTSLDFQMSVMRQRFYNMGEQVKNKIGYPKLLALIITILSTISVSYTFYKKFTKVSQNVQSEHLSTDVGGRPNKSNDASENVWYNDKFELSNYDLYPRALSTNKMCESEFIRIISNNIVHFSLETRPQHHIPSKALCLRGQYYLTNNHNIPVFEGTRVLRVISQSAKEGVNQNHQFTICEQQIYRNVEKDFLIIKLNNLPPRKNIMEYFPKTTLDMKFKGFYVSRNQNGSLNVNKLGFITLTNGNNVDLDNFNNSIFLSRAETPTVLGDCGATMVAQTAKGYTILGAHVVGNTTTHIVGSTMITFGDLESLMPNDISKIQSGTPMLSSETSQVNLIDLHKKSVFRFIDNGTANVYGSFSGFRAGGKSSVCLTPMAPFLSDYGYKIKYGPPEMKSWEPWYIAAQDMLHPVKDINQSILDKCVKSYLKDILNSDMDLSEVMVYDNFTAINGAAGVAYVDKINRNTSAGNPWKKSKKFFMEAIPEQDGMQEPVRATDEIMERVDIMINKYQQGETCMPNFCAHLKDEAVSFKKIKSKKTRVFTGAPFDWTIVVRKFYLSLIRLIQKNRYTFESSPGIIAQSLQWQELFEKVTKYGSDRIICGDYKAFDKTMNPQFILAAFEILIEIAKTSGNYSEQDILVMQGIAQDTANPLIDFNGDLVQFYGSNPSGHPLTVIINGLVNSLYMRYTYYELNPDKECDSFKDNVSLMTYGDDNIMSVNRNINWYTHTTISDMFKKVGITYTMADKEAKSIPFIHVNQASFLKRCWRYDEDVKAFLGPLEHDSIEKMLMVWVKSKSILQEEQTIAVITSAMREYFFYGKEIYQSKQKLLKELVIHLGYELWIHEQTFPSWDYLVDEFYRNSELNMN